MNGKLIGWWDAWTEAADEPMGALLFSFGYVRWKLKI